MRWGRSGKSRFWEWGGDRTRAECRILFNAFFFFEGASFEGHRQRHWKGDNIYSPCKKISGMRPEEVSPSRNLRGEF